MMVQSTEILLSSFTLSGYFSFGAKVSFSTGTWWVGLYGIPEMWESPHIIVLIVKKYAHSPKKQRDTTSTWWIFTLVNWTKNSDQSDTLKREFYQCTRVERRSLIFLIINSWFPLNLQNWTSINSSLQSEFEFFGWSVIFIVKREL
jgi:hypothetical protein